jgi:hypothetical protein
VPSHVEPAIYDRNSIPWRRNPPRGFVSGLLHSLDGEVALQRATPGCLLETYNTKRAVRLR